MPHPRLTILLLAAAVATGSGQVVTSRSEAAIDGIYVSVQSSGPGAGIPCWCSESCGHGPRGGGGDL
jgi:hypothetical protein